MNISKYDFHDGSIIDVKHTHKSVEFSMESAEISDDEIKDNLTLSSHNTLRGKLHLEGVKSFQINGSEQLGGFRKPSDEGSIYDFDIKGNKLTLLISWINYPPFKCYERTDFFRIEIEAEKIYWENIPELVNPYR